MSAIVALLAFGLTKVADATVNGALERIGAMAVEQSAQRLQKMFVRQFDQAADGGASREAWWRFVQRPADGQARRDLGEFIARELTSGSDVSNLAMQELQHLTIVDARQYATVEVSQGPGSAYATTFGSGSAVAIGTYNSGPSLRKTLTITGLITAGTFFISLPVATNPQGVAFLLLGPATVLFIAVWIVAGIRHTAGSGFLLAMLATFAFFAGCMVAGLGAG